MKTIATKHFTLLGGAFSSGVVAPVHVYETALKF